MLTANDHKDYDIADDAQAWQQALKNVLSYATKFDMGSIFQLPNIFDLVDASRIKKATVWTNILTDYSLVDERAIYRWQEFVLTFGSSSDVESDNWMEDTLRLSMDPTLKAEVLSDLEELEELQRGAISIFYLITKRMVIRNQEAKDAMLEWFNTFDIRNYDNQDVSGASLRIKAISRALGSSNLPTNAVRRILDGFSHATNETFKNLCSTSSAMLSSSLYTHGMRTKSVATQLHTVLDDLVAKYLELLGGKKWEGIGHESSAFKAAFTTVIGGQTPTDIFEQYEEARILAAQGNKKLPFAEWVKTAVCHLCGESGHIKPDCPKSKYKSQRLARRSGERTDGRFDRRGARDRSARRPPSGAGRGGDRRKDRRRAFAVVADSLRALAASMNSDDDDDVADVDPEVNDDESTSSSDDEKEDGHVNWATLHEEAVFGSLKD